MAKRVIVRSGKASRSVETATRETDRMTILQLIRDGIIEAASHLPMRKIEATDAMNNLVDILELCYAAAAQYGIAEGDLNHARVKTRHAEGTYDEGWTL